MSGKNTSFNDECQAIQKRNEFTVNKKNVYSHEINLLKRKIEELQFALCTAIDQNDSIRNQLALMEATLDLARTENEEKDSTIQRLKQIIKKSRFMETQGAIQPLLRRKSI